jgi:uncharacterized protein
LIVAVIGDTHLPRGRRRLPEELVARVSEADLVVHTGECSTVAAYDEIRAIGPDLVAVHGNVDEPALRERLPERTEAEIGGARVGVIHDAGPRRGRLARMRRAFPACDAVIFGHSHLPLHEAERGFQIFNPGSPTERRRAPVRSMGICEIARGAIRFRHLALP